MGGIAVKINNYQDALDEHTRLLGSLSPMGRTDKQIRATMIISPLIDSLNEEQTKVLHDMIKNSEPDETFLSVAERLIDSSFGHGYLATEVNSYVASEIASMREAQTIFCSSEIVDEINEAKETMLDTIVLPQDLFVNHGMIVLQKPYLYKTLTKSQEDNAWQCEEFLVNMILFTQGQTRANQSGFSIQLYGYAYAVHFFESETPPEFPYENPDYSFIHERQNGETKYVICNDETEYVDLEKYKSRMHNIFTQINSGSPQFVDGTFFTFGESKTKYDPSVFFIKKFMLAFFRLTYEYLEIDREKPDRPFQKRAKRAGRNIPEDGYITVMSLRRKLYNGESSEETRNSPGYAFRVRGHWKKQYMASRKLPVGDAGAYKHVYIKDYIKGRGVVVRSKRLVKVGD
jgi:hypothetical protein